jgi:hypothetical protein
MTIAKVQFYRIVTHRRDVINGDILFADLQNFLAWRMACDFSGL